MPSPLPLAYWVHNLSPFVVRFGDNIGIRAYGVAYLLGFVIAGWLLRRYHKAGRSPLDINAATDLVLHLVMGVIIGGRLGYFLLYQTGTLLADPLAILRVWEGGMSSHGGFLGVAVALWIFARSHKIGFLTLGDLVVTVAPAGLFFGRIANFINGELWGKISVVRWAVIFPQSAPMHTAVNLIPPRHPSQLYEAGLEGLLLLAFMQWRFWKTDAARAQPGRIAGEFLLAYSLARAISEVYREPDAGLILGLSRGTFYSLFLVAAGMTLIAFAPRKDTPRKA